MSGVREEATVPLHWQGRELAARPGQTVAAALLENGVRSWRRTRVAGRPRGLFCGIGACYDCLVRLDGGPDVRACLVPVSPGLRVDPGGPAQEPGPRKLDSTELDPTVQASTVLDSTGHDATEQDRMALARTEQEPVAQDATKLDPSAQDAPVPAKTVEDATVRDATVRDAAEEDA